MITLPATMSFNMSGFLSNIKMFSLYNIGNFAFSIIRGTNKIKDRNLLKTMSD